MFMSELSFEEVERQPTLAHKAELLGLLEHPRPNIYLVVFNDGYRRTRSLEKLDRDMSPQRETLFRDVLEKQAKLPREQKDSEMSQ
jgi:hypothetical protein